VSAMAVEKQLN